MSDRLLAKSRPHGLTGTPSEITLVGHTSCVLAAIDALFGTDTPTRLGRSWMRFFGLEARGFGQFRRSLRVSAAAHDWGKANNAFQEAVIDGSEQVVRHEHLSGLLLAEVLASSEALSWFGSAGIDEPTLVGAVISHHVKVSPGDREHALGAILGKRDTLCFLPEHDDFGEIWRMVQAEVGSPCPAFIEWPGRWRKKEIDQKSQELKERLDRVNRRLRDDRERRRWLAAVRSALIVADAVGSAVVRFDRNAGEKPETAIRQWVAERFALTLDGKDIWEKVITRRIEELRARKRWDDGVGFEFEGVRGFTRFQCEVATRGSRVLLTAACGSGKTLAAWNWIKAQLDARSVDQPLSRVLFLYPTRATATEGFRDYVAWAPEDDAGLLSGTAAYELEGMFNNPDDPREGLEYRSDPRLYALGHWSKRIFSATADQFFPFMQYQYGPLCLLPLLTEAILVVDEVHSFDASMFNSLRRFLVEFPEVPVLCMTATLSDDRKRDLIKCGLEYYRQEETPLDGEIPDSEYPRYRIRWIDRDEARWLVRGALNDRRRILWVSNRVDDCQANFDCFRDDELTLAGEVTAFCYHSRFKLEDRKERHKQLIQAFQESERAGARPRAVLGCTTQVCELSLDLSVDILLTALAPIASLIQRLGRCNRDSKRMRGRPIGRVYVLRPEEGREKPYKTEDLKLAHKFVDELDGRDVSQADLEQLFRKHDIGGLEPVKLCPFLDSGVYADGKEDSFRDLDEFTVPCILDRDESRILEAIQAKRPIDGFIVPVPRWLASEPDRDRSRLPRWLRIAEMSRYCELAGFDGRQRPAKQGQVT